MDFALDAAATAVRDVAADVFARLTPEWTTRFDGPEPGGFDTAAWRALTESGLLALPLPADSDGDDVDVLAVLPLARRMGEGAAVAPAIGTLGSALLLRHVDPDAAEGGPRRRWAPTLTGGNWHAIAIGEPGDPMTGTPRTAVHDGRLNGTKIGVLHADGAAALAVATGTGVVLVASDAPGVSITRTPSSSGWGEYTVRFDDVAVDDADVLGSSDTLRDLYRILLCGYAHGLVAGATRLTADHVSERTQFGKPIALFQAVGQQLADIYVVARSMDLAATAAAWRFAEGLDAERDLAIGTYWIAAQIPATMRTMTHLHGGVGVDITYPLHRYFSLAKDLARLVGGVNVRLDELAEVGETGQAAGAVTETTKERAAGVH